MKTESLVGHTLELIEGLRSAGQLPADARVGRFFRNRRYLGSRDRRAIGEAVYAWLRYGLRAQDLWDVSAAGRERPSVEELSAVHARLGHLAELFMLAGEDLLPWSYAVLRDSAPRISVPREVDEEEGAAGDAAGDAELQEDRRRSAFWQPVIAAVGPVFSPPEFPPDGDPGKSLALELSLPAWLASRLLAERGLAEARRLGSSLLQQATVDLRVNLRRASRETVRRGLEEELGVAVEVTPYSQLGLRLRSRKNLTGTKASRRGWIEVADEGSQLVTLCLDVEPGMVVIDACAGAGGKTLALADLLDLAFRRDDDAGVSAASGGLPSGQLIACDVSSAKLGELRRRATDADMMGGLSIVDLAVDGPLPPEVPLADRVLVDAPCSGLGTLRRNPELKWRHSEADIATFARRELEILERFATRVRPGGLLAYVTCSILAEENEDVVDDFARRHPDFEECASQWAKARLPLACLDGHRVRLDPARSGTDGFFLTLWRRREVGSG